MAILKTQILDIQKAQDGRTRKVFGVANLSARGDGQHFVDHDGDLIPYFVLERAAYEFVKAGKQAGDMHTRMGVGRLIESMVITPQKRTALAAFLKEDAPLAWLVGFEVDDPDTISRIDSGELREFSIGGKAELRQ